LISSVAVTSGASSSFAASGETPLLNPGAGGLRVGIAPSIWPFWDHAIAASSRFLKRPVRPGRKALPSYCPVLLLRFGRSLSTDACPEPSGLIGRAQSAGRGERMGRGAGASCAREDDAATGTGNVGAREVRARERGTPSQHRRRSAGFRNVASDTEPSSGLDQARARRRETSCVLHRARLLACMGFLNRTIPAEPDRIEARTRRDALAPH
jgi:hypothetical protein